MIPAANAVRFGDSFFDADHRRHVNLLNGIEEALLDGDDAKGRRLVGHLLDSIQRHFRNEERVLRRHGYPRLREHARQHEAALVLLEETQARLRSGNVGAALSRLEDVMAFFVDVLSEQDHAGAAYLAERGAATAVAAE